MARDRFYQGEYFRNSYIQTGLAVEIGYFVDLPGCVIAVGSLLRSHRVFSAREFQSLQVVFPVVKAAIRLHWPTLSQHLHQIWRLLPRRAVRLLHRHFGRVTPPLVLRPNVRLGQKVVDFPVELEMLGAKHRKGFGNPRTFHTGAPVRRVFQQLATPFNQRACCIN